MELITGKCINNEGWEDKLTLDKIYNIEIVSNGMYKLKCDDNNGIIYVDSYRFDIIK